MSRRLRNAIDNDEITPDQVTHLFLLQLPDNDQHSQHYVGPVSAVVCGRGHMHYHKMYATQNTVINTQDGMRLC